ncbi:hypothetical protein QQS21_012826 [Conoideocrella luteorostrata]|uniref:Uncharacterized protein n=1 Tax=Conoideocrella luteorostrata TaxID=1105319 RepID=A0AAJ0FMC1_9HYPO|nr:hypothetical protein QQS21_012826 [Conoideocrella luteorostrata]
MASGSTSKHFSISGKTAIVTGAGSGINFYFAKLLLSKGCNVVIADIGLRPEAEVLVSEHSGLQASPRALFAKTDVASWPDLTRMFEVTVAEFGGFDIVCPGAGVYEPHWSNFWHPPGSAESKDSTEAGRYAQLDINLTHPIRTTQLALQHWLYPPETENKVTPAAASTDNLKRVILISSVAGQLPVFSTPLYGASKYAISGFTRCLAHLEPTMGVRVNAVAPGIVKTPLWTEHPEKLVKIDQDKDGWVTPEEVASAMLDCVESETHVGGTVLEIGKNYTRQVQVLNDPGPDLTPGAGVKTSNSEEGNRMVFGWLGDESIWSVHK